MNFTDIHYGILMNALELYSHACTLAWNHEEARKTDELKAFIQEFNVDDDDWDDGQPSDLQEHEDFAQDNVFERDDAL